MAITGVDAYTASSPGTTISSFNHAGGTPSAVIVGIGQTNTTDEVTGVTYGGVSLTEVAGSPLAGTTEGGIVYLYFLGSGVPSGTQSVAIGSGGTTGTKQAFCITLNATGNVEIVDVDATITGDTITDTSVTLTGDGRTLFACLVGYTGENAYSTVTELTDWTVRTETSSGSEGVHFYTYNTLGTANVTAGWTQGSNDALQIALAVAQVTGGGSSFVAITDTIMRRRRQ